MSHGLLFLLTFASAIGSGLMAGFFFAFSTPVMGALGRIPPAHGIAAMQAINVVVINPLFLGVFLGTAVACVLLAALAPFVWHGPGLWALLAGTLLYFAGTFLVTMTFNVPLNNALAAVAADSEAGASLWRRYLSDWTMWNHVRTVAALAAAVSLTVTLCLQARAPAAM